MPPVTAPQPNPEAARRALLRYFAERIVAQWLREQGLPPVKLNNVNLL